MIIAGGSYMEHCVAPEWKRLLGSGGRAAAAVANLSPNSTLHTYASAKWAADIELSMQAFGVTCQPVIIDDEISF